MKLEIGMYVRTKKGEIFKFVKIENEHYRRTWGSDGETITTVFELKNVAKASHNIIDLIEVGDYVNGYYVTTGNQNVGSIYIAEIDGLGLKKKLYNKDIKSIVTKEQFESMSYRLGD